MLTIFRRHLKNCKHAAKGRKHRHCNCPIAVEGTLNGVMVRKTLDRRDWEAAHRLVREWEIQGRKPVTVSEAADRFMADRESAKLSTAMLGKYRNVADELKAHLGLMPLRNVTVDDIRRIKEAWKHSPITIQKRLERVRKFFAFCVDSEWLARAECCTEGEVVAGEIRTDDAVHG